MRCPFGFILEQSHGGDGVGGIDSESVIDPIYQLYVPTDEGMDKLTLVVGQSSHPFLVPGGSIDHRNGLLLSC